MPIRPNLPVGITPVTPPAIEDYTKSILVSRTDTTAFEAVYWPKGTIISGVYVIGQTASDAGTTATISVGTNPGTTNEALAAFDVKGATGKGYNPAGAFAGTSMGVVNASQAGNTTDVKLLAKYTETGGASTTGGPWLVKIEYYYPPQGTTY